MKRFALTFCLLAAVAAVALFVGHDPHALLAGLPLLAMDIAKVREAAKAGHGADIMREWREIGITFDERIGAVAVMHKAAQDVRMLFDGESYRFAADAQPELVTSPNGGIPAYLTNVYDPRIIQVLVSPMKATEIVGNEEKKGQWETTHAQFLSVELTGETSSYGDYNNNGSSGANLNFPIRQSYLYQTFSNWGELQMARAGAAKVPWAAKVTEASILVLNKQQNASYFFGVAGIPNYGLLNDPNLYAPIAATSAWNATATGAEVVYEDIRRMFVQLQLQSNGVIEMGSPITLAMSPVLSVALNKTNQFNVNVYKLLKDNFPNITIKTAVEYSTAAGEFVQLICTSVEGQETATTAYTEKMRAHAVVTGHSSWSQKKSQGTFGTVIFNTFAIVGLIGA